MEDGEQKRQKFLWKAAQTYSVACPQLAASMMRRYSSSSAGNRAPPTCPYCSAVFTSENSRTRILGAGPMRAKRRCANTKCKDIPRLTQATSDLLRSGLNTRKKYLVTHCRVCRRSVVVAEFSKPRPKPPSLQSEGFKTPQPLPASRKRPKRSSSKRSSLKKALSRQSPRHVTPVAMSPSLQDFLTL